LIVLVDVCNFCVFVVFWFRSFRVSEMQNGRVSESRVAGSSSKSLSLKGIVLVDVCNFCVFAVFWFQSFGVLEMQNVRAAAYRVAEFLVVFAVCKFCVFVAL
jgi:hypothetical protein